MARTAQETSTSVNFRMPDSILKNMDRLASENNHDRTAEINGACRHWITIGGNAAADVTTFQKIAQLEAIIQQLSAETAEMQKNFLRLEQQISTTLEQIEKERELLLKIIQSNENTIKHLLTASLKEKNE